MSSLRAAGVGPIVGHTTDTSARIWIRADPENDSSSTLDSQTRTVGVIGIIAPEGAGAPRKRYHYFRLHREFDRSGTITLGEGDIPGLKPDTRYVVRVGTLLLDDPIDDDEGTDSSELRTRLPSPDVWKEDLLKLPAEKSEAAFRTFPAKDRRKDKLDFLMGSCRYPGLLWKIRHADRIFGPMAEQVEEEDGTSPPRFTMMMGDQIYADLLNRFVPIGRADTYEEFRERYLTAFSSRNIRRLMRQLPTYMILDDHEIEDNWTQDRIRRDAKHQLFTIAIDAYLSYQWSHGPRTFGKRLYYTFECGGYPFFVLDTWTQRYLESSDSDLDAGSGQDGQKSRLEDNHMLGRPTLPGSPPGQLLRLTNWLKTQQEEQGNVPKFIVTSSVFVPSPMSGRAERGERAQEKSDSWPGFPKTRETILRCILDNGVQNVVFLAGDIHCANVAKMTFTGSPEARATVAYSVTSSAFYWPFPFADGEPSDFVHDSKAEGQADSFHFTDGEGRDITMDYKAWNFTQEDNFCRLSIDRRKQTLRVRVFDKKGELVEEEKDGRVRKKKLDESLKLKRW